MITISTTVSADVVQRRKCGTSLLKASRSMQNGYLRSSNM
jgi:hypothetical protein